MTAPKHNDRIITDGFPDGWHVQDRLDEGVALLCRRGSMWGNYCICVRPRATPTDEWLNTARMIARGYEAQVDIAVDRAIAAAEAQTAERDAAIARAERAEIGGA